MVGKRGGATPRRPVTISCAPSRKFQHFFSFFFCVHIYVHGRGERESRSIFPPAPLSYPLARCRFPRRSSLAQRCAACATPTRRYWTNTSRVRISTERRRHKAKEKRAPHRPTPFFHPFRPSGAHPIRSPLSLCTDPPPIMMSNSHNPFYFLFFPPPFAALARSLSAPLVQFSLLFAHPGELSHGAGALSLSSRSIHGFAAPSERAIYVSDGGDVTKLKLLLLRRVCVLCGGFLFLFLTAEFHAKFVFVLSLSTAAGE